MGVAERDLEASLGGGLLAGGRAQATRDVVDIAVAPIVHLDEFTAHVYFRVFFGRACFGSFFQGFIVLHCLVKPFATTLIPSTRQAD